MRRLYFAYGSNMSTARLQARVASACALGAARLRGKRWVCNKRGRDGTAKANLADDSEGVVWGVLWRLDPADWEVLDRFEGGYRRLAVRVENPAGGLQDAVTYASERLTEDAAPSETYRRWLVEGAREHGLPADWIAALERLPTRPDAEPA